MKKKLVLFLFILIAGFKSFSQNTIERRKQYLNDILKINLPQKIHDNTRRVTWQDSTWLEWLKRSGELPPDFSKMQSIPFLPNPLTQIKGNKTQTIKTLADWEIKRNWIKKQYQHWVSGECPPAPKDFKVKAISSRVEDGTLIQTIQTNFGPDYKAKITFELMIPTGKGPFPVYMTQWTHRSWAQLAVRRGYIGCVYAAGDTKDDTQDYQALYPKFDFSMLMRRAWGASRVVDYLLARKEVNKSQIAITGHSRNGKQSLWAGAFDDRISAVISSSSGTGGDSPWRFGDPQYASETLDIVTSYNAHWFHPRLNFFFGHEDKLPVDQNSLCALIAPRPLLFQYSLVERGLNPWAVEQNYYDVQKVYDFLHAKDNLKIYNRYGEHAVAARDVEYGIDFLDIQFHRKEIPWHNNFYYDYNYQTWEKNNIALKAAAANLKPVFLKDNYTNISEFESDKVNILKNLKWLLGPEPAGVKPLEIGEALANRQDWISSVIGLPQIPGAKIAYFGPYTSFGDHFNGVLYYPVTKAGDMKLRPNKKIPVVIYAHQYANSTGFAVGYNKNGGNGTIPLFTELINKGFAVLAIDMFGFGTRIEEANHFYDRFPKWSKMGKYVTDVKGCIDGLEMLDYTDKNNIFLLGNSIGGSTSLMAAATDPRVAGVAVVAAFSPWRTANSRYESIKDYSALHDNIPRLGFFANVPKTAPVDFGEIIAAIAPRPTMIIAPELDRYTDIPALKSAMNPVLNVYRLYNQPSNITVKYPHEINRMTDEMFKQVSQFYTDITK